MRKADVTRHQMFSYRSLEDRIAASHPLRRLRIMVDGILKATNAEFEKVNSRRGRASCLCVDRTGETAAGAACSRPC